MRARILVEGLVPFDIPCGGGQQTVRWLAGVVLARLRSSSQLWPVTRPDSLMVAELRNEDDEPLDPRDRLYEHMDADEEHVTVKAILANSFPVDEYETPIYSDWQRAAHLHSEAGAHWAAETEVWRESLQAAKEKTSVVGPWVSRSALTAINKGEDAVISSRLLKIGFNLTEADVETAFNLDWPGLHWNWLQPTELLRSRIGDTLKQFYGLVCNLFCHYAGTGKLGKRYGMTVEEFGHMLHYMNIVHFKTDERDIENYFFMTLHESVAAAMVNVTGPSNHSVVSNTALRETWPLMTRPHLAEALIVVASKHFSEDPVDIALRKFLDGPVKGLWESLTSSYMQYNTEDPALRQAVNEFYFLVRHVFHQRASIDSKFGPRLAALDFVSMMSDSTLVDHEQVSLCLNAVLTAQMQPATGRDLEYLVFAEFLEAVAVLAENSIENYPGLNVSKKVRMGFNLIVELAVGSSSSHK